MNINEIIASKKELYNKSKDLYKQFKEKIEPFKDIKIKADKLESDSYTLSCIRINNHCAIRIVDSEKRLFVIESELNLTYEEMVEITKKLKELFLDE